VKKRTLLFLIICFVGLCAYLFIVFNDEAEKTAIRQLNEEQQIHAKQAAHGIEDYFATWTGILNSFSKMDTMVSVDADGKRNMTLFYEAHHDQIRSITRVDEGGRILHTVPNELSIGSDISGQQHIREILRDHKPVVSDVFKTVQGFDAVALHVPVFKGATFKGTIAIVIDFENLAKRYLEVIKMGGQSRWNDTLQSGPWVYRKVRSRYEQGFPLFNIHGEGYAAGPPGSGCLYL
jgi:two-component system, cell cycle sensor histidine kinase and response regulator CckA